MRCVLRAVLLAAAGILLVHAKDESKAERIVRSTANNNSSNNNTRNTNKLMRTIAQEVKQCLRLNHTKVDMIHPMGKKYPIPAKACGRSDLPMGHNTNLCSLNVRNTEIPPKLVAGATLQGGGRNKGLLKHVPKGGRLVEIGTLTGDLAEWMLINLQPKLLVIVDLDKRAIGMCKNRHAAAIARGQAQCVLQPSGNALRALEDESFDLIYIDGAHGYPIVCDDMEAARSKLKPGALMVMNDYYLFETLFLATKRLAGRWMTYGVMHATNEFIIRYGWKIVYMTLHQRQEPDLAIRKPMTSLE